MLFMSSVPPTLRLILSIVQKGVPLLCLLLWPSPEPPGLMVSMHSTDSDRNVVHVQCAANIAVDFINRPKRCPVALPAPLAQPRTARVDGEHAFDRFNRARHPSHKQSAIPQHDRSGCHAIVKNDFVAKSARDIVTEHNPAAIHGGGAGVVVGSVEGHRAGSVLDQVAGSGNQARI